MVFERAKRHIYLSALYLLLNKSWTGLCTLLEGLGFIMTTSGSDQKRYIDVVADIHTN
jgi:hypothetical protein